MDKVWSQIIACIKGKCSLDGLIWHIKMVGLMILCLYTLFTLENRGVFSITYSFHVQVLLCKRLSEYLEEGKYFVQNLFNCTTKVFTSTYVLCFMEVEPTKI